MCMTATGINHRWIQRSTVIDFKRFHTPHTDGNAATLLFDENEKSGISKKMRSSPQIKELVFSVVLGKYKTGSRCRV